jgi:hypothetical protein
MPQQRKQQGNHHRRQTWRLLLALLVVFATGAQQLVAQTHWHDTVAASSAGSGLPDDGAGTHDDCLWCQIAAHASAGAPPESLHVLLAPQVFAFPVPAGLHAVVVPRPAHAWQSRGPPSI